MRRAAGTQRIAPSSASNESLDILYVGPLAETHTAGAGMTNIERLNAFVAGRHRVRALVPYRPERNGVAPISPHPDIPVVRLDLDNVFLTQRPPVSRIQQIATTLRPVLRDLVQTRRPDVLVVGVPQYAPGSGATALEFDLPWVLWEHGVLPVADGPGFPPALAPLIFGEVATAHRIVACANHVAEQLRKKGLDRVDAIPNAIDTHRFTPNPRDPALATRLKIAPDTLVVLLAARLDPLKRPQDIVAAASFLQTNAVNAVFVVAGEGPCRDALQQECRGRGLDGCFRFVGGVDYSAMPDFMRLADMVVMPSSTEGLARVYLEAQASGRVLVASDIPAAREVVTPEKTGLLFRVGDPADLAGRVEQAAKQPMLRDVIGRNARQFALERHGMAEMLTAHEHVLRRVARKSASSGI